MHPFAGLFFGDFPEFLFNISDVVNHEGLINPMLMRAHQHRVSHIIALRAIVQIALIFWGHRTQCPYCRPARYYGSGEVVRVLIWARWRGCVAL